MSHTADPHRILTEAELREVIPEPHPAIQQKIFDHVDPFARAFIERSPLLLLATVGADDAVDVSPKGDAPGFVRVEDEKTLVIPDRPGNKLADGFRNMLQRPAAGIIFLVPGVSETLRVNGRVELTRDPRLLEELSARGRPALLATRVRVEECFFHCGKAFLRAALWKPGSWPQGVKADIGRQLARRARLEGAQADELARRIEEGLEADYREGL